MQPILIVDDEKDLCDSLARILRREFPSREVHNTTNPNQAIQWLQRETPALLITDIRMPEFSGLDIVSKANDAWGTIPTIIMTAFA